MARPAYVLSEDAGTGTVAFPGFPGIWTPGVPIAVDELLRHGLFDTAAELADAVEDRGLPLEETEVSGDEGSMPVPPNHRLSRDEALEAAVEETPRPRTKRQAEKLAAERGHTFSSGELTLAEMNEELFAGLVADAQPPLSPETPPPPADEEGEG